MEHMQPRTRAANSVRCVGAARKLAIPLLVVILGGAPVWGEVPRNIDISGRLTDADGNPLPSGPKTFTFKLFNAPAAGAEVWPLVPGEETQIIDTDANGLWSAHVGATSSVPLTDAYLGDSARWLEIVVNDGVNTETPGRIKIAAHAFAFRVSTIDGSSGGVISGDVGVNTGTPLAALHADGGSSRPGLRGESAASGGLSSQSAVAGINTAAYAGYRPFRDAEGSGRPDRLGM